MPPAVCSVPMLISNQDDFYTVRLCALIPLLLHLSSYTSKAQLNKDFRVWPRSLARLLQAWCCPGTLEGLLRCFGFRQERSSVKLGASVKSLAIAKTENCFKLIVICFQDGGSCRVSTATSSSISSTHIRRPPNSVKG
jgi:hypothetical protein